MPEYAQLAIPQLPVGIGLHRGIDSQILMVPGQNLDGFSV